MTFEKSYQKYTILAESNGTTSNLATDRGRFATKYNIAQNKVIEWLIESNSTDENRYLQSIKVPFESLSVLNTKEDYTQFSLPKGYFDFIGLKVLGSNDKCKKQRFKTSEKKAENVDTLYLDVNSEPSFKFRETFYTIANNAIQVFKKGFNLDSANLTYYRYPKQITLENPDNPESKFSIGELEFDDKLINRIIFMTVALHELSSDDPKYQAFKQETIQKF